MNWESHLACHCDCVILFLLSAICFSPFLRYYRSYQYFILLEFYYTIFKWFHIFNILPRHYCAFLNCMSCLDTICASRIVVEFCAGVIHSLQQSTPYSFRFSTILSDFHIFHLFDGSKYLFIFILPVQSQMTQTSWNCMISPLTCAYVCVCMWGGVVYMIHTSYES